MSDHHHYNSSGGGFLNGFLLGALIGAGLVFFLGTKRGKELAKEISDKGLSALEDAEDVFEEIEQDSGDGSPSLPPESSFPSSSTGTPGDEVPPTTTSLTNGNGNGNGGSHPPEHIQTLQAHGRRLFHGIPKRM